MYFISRNNRFYSFIVHTKPSHRYYITAAIAAVSIGLIYYIPHILETYHTIYAQEEKNLHNQLLESKQTHHRNNELNTNIEKLKATLPAPGNHNKESASIIPLIINNAISSGLTVDSYNTNNLKDKQWYTKEQILFSFSGTVEQIMHFFSILEKSDLIISISNWSITRNDQTTYNAQCTITVPNFSALQKT